MRPQCSVALSAAAVLAALPGCGGGEALTKAEYIKQADAICKDYAARQQKLGDPKDIKDIERLADQTKPLIQERLDKLRELEAPEEIKDRTDAAYGLIEEQLPKIDELKAAAKRNDVKRIQSIATSAGKLDAEAKRQTKAIGLKVCGASA